MIWKIIYCSSVQTDNKNVVLLAGLGLSAGVVTSLMINYLYSQRKQVNCIKEDDISTVQALPSSSPPAPEEDEDLKRRNFIQDLIKTNKGKHKGS